MWVANVNRNSENISGVKEYWLSSRCIGVNWGSSGFCIHCVSNSGSAGHDRVYGSNDYVGSSCRGLRPVLQVSKY